MIEKSLIRQREILTLEVSQGLGTKGPTSLTSAGPMMMPLGTSPK